MRCWLCVCVCVYMRVCELYRLSKAVAIFKYLLGLLLLLRLLLLGGRLFLQCFKPDWPELFPLWFRARLLAGRNPNWRWRLLLAAAVAAAGRDYYRLWLTVVLLLVVVAVPLRRTRRLLLTRRPNTWFNYSKGQGINFIHFSDWIIIIQY